MSNVVELMDDATKQTLVFFCPGCRCSHGVTVKLKGATQGPLWSWNGSFDLPTITPSILVRYGREPRPDLPNVCHSFVTDGMIRFCADTEHELTGKTVKLESVE